MNADLFHAWLASGLALAALSFLVRDNPASRLAEHLFAGLSVGYAAVLAVKGTLLPSWWAPLRAGNLAGLFIPTLLGLLLLGSLHAATRRFAGWGLAALAGFGAGAAIPRIVESHVLRQIHPALADLPGGGLVAWASLAASALVLLHTTATGTPGPVRKRLEGAGGLCLTAFLGAAFGAGVPGRFAVLQDQLTRLADACRPSLGCPALVLGAGIALVLLRARHDNSPR